MPRLCRVLTGAAIAASLSLALFPAPAVSASKGKIRAFNPQPDPPGKNALKAGGTKGWKSIHDVEKSNSKSGKTKVHLWADKSKQK